MTDSTANLLVQVGVNHGAINLVAGAVPSDFYLEQVRRIAPDELVGREAELAELAAFCAGPDRYLWWRAEAWAGKSALLSWFALHPPEGVRIVSFFITAGLAEQSDRSAFLREVTVQLCALLGTPLPREFTDPGLLGLLKQAAERCEDQGERLVLVVDGLDEDRGADGSAESHSIAALLPANPPAGTRVVVSGRLNPPLPHEVPEHHPLRDPDVIRPLSPSPEAKVKRDVLEKDLKRLLRGTPAARDVLGLLVASGSGLTTADLEELTGHPPVDVEDVLHTASGRSFTNSSGEAHLFAHNELRLRAADMLGKHLGGYRERLHAWADGYRDRAWPQDTPEYLVRGYPAMLESTNEVDRLVDLATDPNRHALLLTRTGADEAALSQVAAAQRVVGKSDLLGLARLGVHKAHLRDRNVSLHPDLPAAWAAVGEVERAEAIISTMSPFRDRLDALLVTSSVIRQNGDRDKAGELLDTAEAMARPHTQFFGADHLRAVAEALNEFGEHERARELALTIRNEGKRSRVLDALTSAEPQVDEESSLPFLLAVVQDGRIAEARGMVQREEKRFRKKKVKPDSVSIGWIAVAAGREDYSRAAADAVALRTEDARAQAWATIAEEALLAGRVELAERFLAEVDQPSARRRPLLELVRVLLSRGDSAHAAEVAGSAKPPRMRAEALLLVARACRTDKALRAAARAADSSGDVRLLRDALLLAVDMNDRKRAHKLLRKFRKAIPKGREDLPAEIRTMTEVADLAVQVTFLTPLDEDFSPSDDHDPDYLGTSSRLGEKPPSTEDLAASLIESDWPDVVQDLVALHPAAYDVIATELDRLTGSPAQARTSSCTP
ncbi:hypothetical protein [Actinosynnema pretiosum]|uniref:hypothetical protein n=1 Tax=Actinosynnema pretiosum TaxID=42197 RepID=UPI0012FDE771|nr:hypothetical protein [Actinosynnema pretiosum]